MNIEQMLAMRLAETFTIEGIAPNMNEAHNIAWRSIASVLGADDLTSWALKGMQHQYTIVRDAPAVAFKAEFVRTPDEEES